MKKQKTFTQKDYDNYMIVVNESIKETERRLESLGNDKKVASLSFSDWVKFQNGELKLESIQIKTDEENFLDEYHESVKKGYNNTPKIQF